MFSEIVKFVIHFLLLMCLVEFAYWVFNLKRNRIENVEKVIRVGKATSEYGQPLQSNLLNLAYMTINILFNEDWHGFADCNIYVGKEITTELRRVLQSSNPPHKNCINFYVVMPTNGKIGHTMLGHYNASDRTCTMYDGTEWIRTVPLKDYVKEAVLCHHANADGTLRAGYSREYSIQGDNWSCSYRALFACFALLHGQDPDNFDPDLEQIFFITKFAVENCGEKLRFWTLEQIWSLIAIHKRPRNQAKQPVVFEKLT